MSWYDAIAFCRWLTEKVKVAVEVKAEGWETRLPKEVAGGRDWQITLPTEQQWEKAACGQHAGWQYPWGEKYISGHANIDELNSKAGAHYLPKTGAVGMYPQGASPWGVLDMSGNVWEWCLNEYAEPAKTQEAGDAPRVLRGGSWFDYVETAAARWRSRNFPGIRGDDVGFRVVLASSSPSALRPGIPDSEL